MPSPEKYNDEALDEARSLLGKKIYVTNEDIRSDKVVVRNGRLLLVWFVSFIFMVAYQISAYTFGQFMYIKLQKESYPNVTIDSTKSVCETNTSSITYKIQEDVQEKAAKWGIYFYLAGGVVGIISNFVLGAYTDRFGRKFLFICPCLGTSLRTVLATTGMQFDFPLYYYTIGYFIEGCTGQIFSIFQVSFLYTSDITSLGKQRSFALVSIEMAFGIGSALPAIGTGYILSATGSFLIPMYISCGLLLFSILSMIALPETFPKELRARRKYSTYFENLKDASDLYFSSKNYGRRWMYILMLMVFILSSYGVLGRVAIEGLYLLNNPFCFGPDKIGIFNSLKTGLQQIFGVIVVAFLLRFTKDEVIVIIACISFGAAFVMEALATSEWTLYIVSVVGCCGLLTLPMVRSIMSQMTSPQKQGAVFASISATETTINLISAVSSNTIYLATVSIYRGFIFFVFASLNGVCLLLTVIFMIGSRSTKAKYVEID